MESIPKKKPHKAQICMIVIASVSSTASDESLKLDFKLRFLPQILTDVIQTALDAQLLQYFF